MFKRGKMALDENSAQERELNAFQKDYRRIKVSEGDNTET